MRPPAARGNIAPRAVQGALLVEDTDSKALSTAVPAWCTPPTPLVGRGDVVARAVQASAEGPVTLVGRAGAGATAVAGAVALSLAAQLSGSRVVGVRADPAMEVSDLLRGIGLTLGIWPPADAVAVTAELARRPTIVVIDDADAAAAALAPVLDLPARFVLTARRPLAGTAVNVGPLSDADIARMLPDGANPVPFAGLPGAARFGGAAKDRPFAGVDGLPPGAEVEVAITCGVPEHRGIKLPAQFLVPVPGRIVARRSVREALALPPEPSSESLSAVMRGRKEDARRIAADLVLGGTDVDDLLFFALSAKRIADPDLAAYAAAAAGRLHLHLAEPLRAQALVTKALRERPPGDRVALGLLHWLAGDAALDCGEGEAAHESHKLAVRALQEGGWRRGISLLARAAAARWAALRNVARTRRWLAEARDTTVLRDEPAAWADHLRIAGDLAAAANETMSAGNLYDEALAVLERGSSAASCAEVRAHVLCGQAAIEAARGDTGQAEQLLAAAERSAAPDTGAQAVIAFRRAELSLRRGRPDDALAHVEEAHHRFLTDGDGRGVQRALQLRGDIHAVAGRPTDALAAWTRSLSLAAPARDVLAARALLTRLVQASSENAASEDLTRAVALADGMLRS